MASSPSQDFTPIYQAAGQSWNVDPALLQAVAGQEHGGVSNVSPAGAQGHMQIMPATQRDLGVTDPNNVTQSIYGGAKYLSQLLDRYKGQPDPVSTAVAAYNAGPGRIDDVLAGKSSLPAETAAYVPGVAQRYQAINRPASNDGGATNRLNQTMATLQAQPAAPAPAAPDAGQAPGLSDDDLMKALTGSPSSSAQPASAPGVPSDDDLMKALTGGQPAPAPPPPTVTPSGTPIPSVPAAQTSLGPVGDFAVNMAEGAGHAVQQASNTLYHGIDYLNKAMPVGSNTAGGLINAPAAISNLDAQNAAYNASGTGNTVGGMAGNLVGQGALFAPVGGAIASGAGALGGALAGGIDAVVPGVGAALAGNPLVRLAGYGASGAAQGGAFGAATTDDGQSVGRNVLLGAVGGGALGAAIPAVAGAVRAGGGAIANALSSVSPETAALAQRAQQLGIDVRPAQMMQDGFIKTADNQLMRLPGTGGAADTAQQARQFTGAVAKAIDPTAPATATVDRAFVQGQRTKIGGVLNTIETNNSVNLNDPQFINDLSHIQGLSSSTLDDQEQKQVNKLIDNVLTNLGPNGEIDGATFGNLIHKGSALDSASGNRNSNIANVSGDIQDALRGAMQRSLPPDQAQAYQDARFAYKNLMTVAPLVDGPNPGMISPTALAGRVKANFGTDRVFSPATPLDELAQIGQRFLKEPANSGTADRTVVNRLMVDPVRTAISAGTGLASLGGAAVTSPLTTAGTVAGTAALAGGAGMAARGVANVLRSPYLANKLVSGALKTAAPTALPGMVPYNRLTGTMMGPAMKGAGNALLGNQN